jgi:UDP-N-acetylglucosamine--dolichyl-phosphate N-acetylglucosaminephosphotransferase
MMKREGEGIFEKMKRQGIPAWAYFLLPLPAAIPLVAVNAGVSHMSFPFLGRLELGVLYPLVCIPIAVLCCSNATNFFAGFNGLEAGTGFILHTALGLYAYINQEYNAALIALTFAASLLAFLKYNWYPAKIFPGDLNYTIGAATVCVAVIGNIEKFAIIAFIPWIIEAFLKALSGFKAESFGILQEDDTIKPHKKGIRSLTHLIMKISSFKEWQVSLLFILIETSLCIIAYIIMPMI